MALPLVSIAQIAPAVRIRIPARAIGATVPQFIAGLGYEIDNLRDPRFFAAANTSLVEAFPRLNPQGVLRRGGNTSDLARPAGFDRPLPVLHPLYRKRDQIQPYYDVTPAALDALASFLDATGWKLIFGINMRARLRRHLLVIQLGNEANNYFKSYEAYKAAWARIVAPLGRAGIAGPDSGANTDWVCLASRGACTATICRRLRGTAVSNSTCLAAPCCCCTQADNHGEERTSS